MERVFTNREQAALRAAFTNIDSNVYCVRSSVPSPTWAFLCGAYSRSVQTMREKFLASIRESVSASTTLVANVDYLYDEVLGGLSAQGSSDVLMAKVEKFLSHWAVAYGHNSLKDSAQERIAVEHVTIRAAKWLEWHPLGAYQEKSTRYVDFSKESPILKWFPEHAQPKAGALYYEAVALYEEILNTATQYYLFQDRNTDLSASVRKKAATAKAFDVARYVIPAYAPTSLGITISSRAAEAMVRYLLSHENQEAVELGLKIKSEIQKINPALIKHVSPVEKTAPDTRALVSEILDTILLEPFGQNVEVYKSVHSDVTLTTAAKDSAMHPRWACAAALIKEIHGEVGSMNMLTGVVMSKGTDGSPLLDDIWRAGLANRGDHEEFPDALDSVFTHLEGTLDFGAYRDMQRHRRGAQPHVDTSMDYGYSVPEFLNLASSKSLLARYEDLMQRFSLFRRELDHDAAQYALCLGHNVHYSYACSVKQLAYILELRTGPSGHESYRKFCQAIAKEFLEAVPEAKPYLRVDWSTESTRAAAEAAAEQKAQTNAR